VGHRYDHTACASSQIDRPAHSGNQHSWDHPVSESVSPDNQPDKRDNQDGKFFEGVVFESFGSDLTL
jgi:hypothetical protein